MSLELGTYGIWLGTRRGYDACAEYAVASESLGYRTVWFGFGVDKVEDLALVDRVLDATTTLTVATGIVNMWPNDATAIARSFHRIRERHGDRVLLGVGVGHPEAVQTYQKPYDKMVEYLDQLDDGGVPRERVVLAALGPRAVKLAADRTAGAHPYLTVPDHTRAAREILGPDKILAPEQKVVLETDAETARAIARPAIENPYLHLTNYVRNLLRHGFTEADIANGGSDRLVDALSPHGTPETVATALAAHLDAGADHVAVQVLTAAGQSPVPAYQALAPVLLR
jgi:probable F420-dependent oxidoreductase